MQMRAISLGLCLIVSLLACGKSRVEKLSDRADAYNRSLRWSSLSAASLLIEQEKRRSLIDQVGQWMGRQRIVDFSIIDMSTDSEQKTGSVMVEFSYYNISDQNLAYRQEVQTWKYNSKAGDWFLSEAKNVP